MKHSQNSFVSRADSPTTASTIRIPNIQKPSTLLGFYFRLRQVTRLFTSILRKHTNSDSIHRNEAEIGFAEHRNGKEELLSALSRATDLVLSTHQDTTSLAPVPYLSEAAVLAVEIWNTVQKNNRNAESSLPSLAEDASRLVYTMWMTCDEVLLCQREARAAAIPQTNKTVQGEDDEEGEKRAEQEIEELIPQLEVHLRELCFTLNEILDFASRNVVLTSSDSDKVAQYRSEIESVSFWFTSTVMQHNSSRVGVVQQRATEEMVQMMESASVLPTTDSVSAEVTASSTFREVEASPVLPVPSGSFTTALGGFPAEAVVFNFAGATFQTGDTIFPTPIAGHKATPTTASENSQAKPEADSEIIPQSSIHSGSRSSGDSSGLDNQGDVTRTDGAVASGGGGDGRRSSSVHTIESEPRPELSGSQFGGTSGNIQFTSITGDQNISWVNDQSRRWNFGNTYELDPSRGQPSLSRYHGAVGRGRGLPRDSIAALGREAFGRGQTRVPCGHNATLLGAGGMRG